MTKPMKHNNNSIEYEYSERWWITKKKQIMPLTEKQAYERHKKGKPYLVQIYIDGILRYIADVCKDAYIISFIGKDKLSYCTCEYHLTEGRLFLSARYYNIWKNGTIVWQRTNSYDINGEHICTVHEYCVDDRKKAVRSRTAKPTENTDVSSHWFDVPKFGKFEYLLDEKICEE